MKNTFQMPDVSFYNSVKDTIGKTVSLNLIINDIKKGKYKSTINEISKTTNKKERNQLKMELPGFTCSGLFSKRKADCLLKHSGLLQIDIDDVENVKQTKELLIKDQYTFLCFISPSGNGIKLLVKIEADPESHLQSFKELEAYYKSAYGITIDTSTKDVSRLCFTSYDPDLHIHNDSVVYTCSYTNVNENIPKYTAVNKSIRKKQPGKRLNTPEIQQFENILDKIEKNSIDITRIYDDWLKIGFAISNEFGEEGRAYYHRISHINPEYSANKCNTQYTKCLKSDGSGITIATFFDYANKAINSKKPDNDKATPQFYTIFHRAEEDLNKRYTIRFNTLKLDLELNKIDTDSWEKCNLSQLYVDLNKRGVTISEAKLKALLRSDYVNHYDPMTEYLKNLTPWKNGDKDYISELISHLKTKNPEDLRYNFKKWLVRCVKCAIIPDYFNKQAFIIVHKKQNSGKSTFCRNLCPKSLRHFLRDDIPDFKDGKIALASNILINLDELASLNKKDVDQLKTYFSTVTIKERLPFDKRSSLLPRRANFIGSTNNNEFLADSTGSVRWLCFEIEGINWDYMSNIDIDKVWSQAYTLSQDFNFNCEFTEEDIAQNENRNEQFQIISSEEELLLMYFEPNLEVKRIDSNFYTASKIVSYLNDMTTGIKLYPNKIGKTLAKLGFTRVQHSKGLGRGYYIKKKEI